MLVRYDTSLPTPLAERISGKGKPCAIDEWTCPDAKKNRVVLAAFYRGAVLCVFTSSLTGYPFSFGCFYVFSDGLTSWLMGSFRFPSGVFYIFTDGFLPFSFGIFSVFSDGLSVFLRASFTSSLMGCPFSFGCFYRLL